MVALHAGLDGGLSLPTALARARLSAGTDPIAVATAYSFICLGAG